MKRNRRAGVEDRWHKASGERSAAYGTGKRWRARYVDDHGRERARGFTRKTDAQSWLDTIVSAQVTGSYVDPALGKVTFASFYREWSARQVWVSSTRYAMDLTARSVTFGDVALADLRPSHIEAWVRWMQDRPLEPTTIRTRFANVHNVLRAAVRDRMMPRDVSDRIRLPRQRKASMAMAIPTAEDVGATVRAADPAFAVFIAVCAFAGLRRGEASGLKVSDVDFLRREIHVARQVQWTSDGKLEVRPPKYGSERMVYLPDRLVELLAEHVRRHRSPEGPDRWLFPGSGGSSLPVHSASVARWWRHVRAEAGVEHRLHDLRHFYASGLIRAGCDVVTVQRALGHSSAAITLTTYSHLWPDANDRTRRAAGQLLDESLGSTADALRTEG
ncbi:MAG: tyrosine-type recombinase/integrase [Candidatus Sericytochromatia bacterium]